MRPGWFTSRRLVGSLSAVLVLAGCRQASPPGQSQGARAAAAQELIERGKLLVTVGGCHDCHTPKKLGPKGPEPDMSRMLSGHPEDVAIDGTFRPAQGSPWTIATNEHLTAWSGPWGVSFAPNLTPDTKTGLRSGVWTEELFIKAMRSGKHMGTARDILPPMPWFNYAPLSDEDLKAIWAYLGTIPPVTNHVPEPIPPAGPPR